MKLRLITGAIVLYTIAMLGWLSYAGIGATWHALS